MIIKKNGKPITGSPAQMTARPQIKTDSTKSSAQAEQQIKMPPQPFANPKGAAKAPVSGTKPESANADYATGIHKKTVGHKALPGGKAVGQNKPISHAGTVFGRFGTKHPKHKGSLPSAFYGDK